MSATAVWTRPLAMYLSCATNQLGAQIGLLSDADMWRQPAAWWSSPASRDWQFTAPTKSWFRSAQDPSRTNDWYPRAMSKNTSFSLDEHYSAFIEDEVTSGRYRSASDVVRTALRLLEDRETRLRALRQALIAGESSGEPTPFDFDELVAGKREEPRQR